MAAYAGKIGKNARPPTATQGSMMQSRMSTSRMGSAMKPRGSKINTGL